MLGYDGHMVCVQDRIEEVPPFSTALSLHNVALTS